jgi:hypothetical protein
LKREAPLETRRRGIEPRRGAVAPDKPFKCGLTVGGATGNTQMGIESRHWAVAPDKEFKCGSAMEVLLERGRAGRWATVDKSESKGKENGAREEGFGA